MKCHQTDIRPIIKYTAIVWSPHTQSDIHTVKMLQRKAARCVKTFFNISPVNMLGGDTLFTKALACDFCNLGSDVTELRKLPSHIIFIGVTFILLSDFFESQGFLP